MPMEQPPDLRNQDLPGYRDWKKKIRLIRGLLHTRAVTINSFTKDAPTERPGVDVQHFMAKIQEFLS